MISDGNSSDKDGSPSVGNDSLSGSEEGDNSTAPSRQSFSPPQKPRKDAEFDLMFGPEYTAMDIIYFSGGPKPIRGYHPRSEEELDAAEALVTSERQL
ncbi:hypothetical protein A0H81_11541 [Grifola frondosa]|uniref:Uncharacterized protein n=1 Tax=Grifola frondosa TaxID=5627 RepID=A0A1C7LUF2_GRIFR|nr:hypothetical protein A0H81_11541 [Grifola frondosa]